MVQPLRIRRAAHAGGLDVLRQGNRGAGRHGDRHGGDIDGKVGDSLVPGRRSGDRFAFSLLTGLS